MDNMQNAQAVNQEAPIQEQVVPQQPTNEAPAQAGVNPLEGMTDEQLMAMSDEEFEKLASGLNENQIPQDMVQQQANESIIGTDSMYQNSSVEAHTEDFNQTNTQTQVDSQNAQNNAPIASNEQNVDNANQQGQQPTEVNQDLTKAFHDMVTSEFRANGQQFKITDPKDVIQLMQKGLNYNEKMASIKPHVKILRSLDKAGLLTEDKINYLIDLNNHNPSAIAELLKQSNVDTYDLPDLEATPYVAENHMLPDQAITFEETLNELQGTDTGKQLLQAVDKWDDGSMGILYQNPFYLTQLAEQMETGLFRDTVAIIQRERALGRMPLDVPMVDLYNQVATDLLNQQNSKYSRPSWWQQGASQNTGTNQNQNNLGTVPNQQVGQVNYQNQQQVGYNPAQGQVNPYGNQPMQRQVIGNNVQQQVPQHTQAVNHARQAASIPRGQAQPTVETNVTPQDILNMSDEQFAIFQQNIRFR